MATILVTGFGPFPGAPFNPTGPLVQALARLKRPGLADVKIIGHVFATSYDAVDHELPALIARHKPDALLMFGLAARAKTLRIETRARNALALLPDAGGASGGSKIAIAGPAARDLPAPTVHLVNAVRAADAAIKPRGPRLAVFVHVPPLRRKPRPRRAKARLSSKDLVRAGTCLL